MCDKFEQKERPPEQDMSFGGVAHCRLMVVKVHRINGYFTIGLQI